MYTHHRAGRRACSMALFLAVCQTSAVQAVELFSTLGGVVPSNAYPVSSQNFTDTTLTTQGADDFVVTGNGWKISEVRVRGAYFSGMGSASSVNIYILGDTGGLPDTTNLSGAAIYATENLSYTDTGSGDFFIPLPGDLNLTAGTYWLVVQANLDSTLGQWGWLESSSAANSGTPVGSESAWYQQSPGTIPPAGGGGFTCLDTWGARVATCDITDPQGAAPPEPDLAFSLEGTVLTPGVEVTPNSLTTYEGYSPVNYTVVLTAPPTSGQTVDIGISNDATESSISPTSLTFSAANWNVPQTVTVTPLPDGINDGDVIDVISHAITTSDPTYSGVNVASVNMTNINIDGVSVIVADPASGLVTDESGSTATFQISLTTLPSSNVTVPIQATDLSEADISSDGGATYSSTLDLVFTPANGTTPQTVTVRGVDDSVVDGDVSYTIDVQPATSADPDYAGYIVSDINGINLDFDSASIDVNPTSGLMTNETGSTATFQISLGTEPLNPVTIPLASADTSEALISTDGVTFAPTTSLSFDASNWSNPQTVTVRGENDIQVDGNINYTIIIEPATSTDPAFNNLAGTLVTGTNQDDGDTVGITVNPTTGLVTTEAGGTATFSVVLQSPPLATVSIDLSSDNINEGTVSPATLVFDASNWDTPQVVTVQGVDDGVDDGDQVYNIVLSPAVSSDPAYSGFDPEDVNVTNQASAIAVQPVAVPVLNHWALLFMTVLLGGLGWQFVRRHCR